MIYEHKRGATLSLSGQILPVGDTPNPDFTGWSGTAQIRTLADNLISNLDFTWLNRATGAVKISCEETITATWALGVAEIDIRLNTNTPNNEVVITTTQQIMVVKEITRA